MTLLPSSLVDPHVTLNRLLRCELCAVAAYDHVLQLLGDDPPGELTRNRDCHAVRAGVLRDQIHRYGVSTDDVTAPWPACLAASDRHEWITALAQGEEDDLHGYRDRDGVDQTTAELVETQLLPAQQRSRDRLAPWLRPPAAS